MHRRSKQSGRSLSVDDQNAVDVLLDHGAAAPDAKLAKPAAAVQPRRLMAVTKVLELLSQLPAIDPPKDLVARTMARVDQDIAAQAGNRAVNSHNAHKASQSQIH